jgi:hypothetical protein
VDWIKETQEKVKYLVIALTNVPVIDRKEIDLADK